MPPPPAAQHPVEARDGRLRCQSRRMGQFVAVGDVRGPALDDERHGDVQQDRLAARTRLSVEEPLEHPGVGRRVAPGELGDLDPRWRRAPPS